jgi:hypothetical protein
VLSDVKMIFQHPVSINCQSRFLLFHRSVLSVVLVNVEVENVVVRE